MKLYSCLLASALSLSSVSVLADVPEFAHVTTTGYGEVVATPDMATFSVKSGGYHHDSGTSKTIRR